MCPYLRGLCYASCGPKFGHYMRFRQLKKASVYMPETGAICQIVVLTGAPSTYGLSVSLKGGPFPLRASFRCVIVGRGSGAFNCQGSSLSLRVLDPSSRKAYV